jgi:hypothetical protein
MVRGVIQGRNMHVRELNKKMEPALKQAVAHIYSQAFAKNRTPQESTALLEATRKELARLKLRSRSPKRSLDEIEESATASSSGSSSGSNSPSPPPVDLNLPSPKRQRIQITHSISAVKWIAVAGEYRILESDRIRIQNAVEFLLFDYSVRRDAKAFQFSPLCSKAGAFPKPLGSICNFPIDRTPDARVLQLRDFYVARCALLYAIVKTTQQQDMANSQVKHSQTRASRRRRAAKGHGKNQIIDLKQPHVVYVMLQFLTGGIRHRDTLRNAAEGRDPDESFTITEPDSRLQNALPSEFQVMFYGLQKKVRCGIFADNSKDILESVSSYHSDPPLYRSFQAAIKDCNQAPDFLAERFDEATERFTSHHQIAIFDTAKSLDHLEGDIDPIDVHYEDESFS